MKQIISLLIITLLFSNIFSIGNTFAEDYKQNKATLYKQLIISKAELNKTIKGKKYIQTADLFIEKISNDIEKIKKVSNKIDILLENNSIKDKNTLNLVIYLSAKIKLTLIKDINNQDIINEQKYQELKNKDVELYIENISNEDRKIIEDKIIELQLNLLNKGENIIESLTKEFEQISNYEDSGDFELNYKLEKEELGKANINFKLNNYKNIVSNFDSEFKGELLSSIDYINDSNNEEVKLKLNGLINLISKEGNMYVLLEKFNITDKIGINKIEFLLDSLEKIAKENKYIVYSDDETTASIRMIKSLNPNKFLKDSRNILSKPLMTAYKRQGDKFYLKPTKYACEKIMEIGKKINPYMREECNDETYNILLKEFYKSGELYAEILDNNETKIVFKGLKFDKVINKNEGTIVFNNNEILELNYILDDWERASLTFNLDYKSNSNLNFNFKGGEEIKIELNTTLNKNNNFTYIDFETSIKDRTTVQNYNLKLENKNISGNFNIDISTYDWNTQQTSLTNRFSGDISGKTDFNNKLAKLEINYSGQDLIKKEEHINGSLLLTNSELKFENKTNFDRSKSNILIYGNLDRNKLINSGKVEISISEKEYLRYDPKTYQSIYSEDYNEVFNTNIDINNKNISGNTTISNKGEEIITINHKGNFSEKKFKLDNKYEMINSFAGYSIDARNSKRTSDLSSIISKMSIELTKGVALKSFSDGNYINYLALDMKESEFSDIDGTPYEIRIKGNKYQLMAKLEDGNGNKRARLKGNSTESLFIINGKILEDGDVIERGLKVISEEKISGNFNIDIDYYNNKNNIELFLNILLGKEEFFSGNIKNIGKRIYKKTDIKTPKDAVDYKEVFDIPEKNYYY